LVLWVAGSIVRAVVQIAYASEFANAGTKLQAMWHAAEQGQQYDGNLAFSGGLTALTWLGTCVSLAGLVLVLIWQFRAARDALQLSYPAKRSPALGVGSWFIPVVQLWFPYQAIRDCLGPGHRTRRLVLAWWLGMILSGVVILAALSLELAAVGPWRALWVATMVLAVALGLALWRITSAIAGDHRGHELNRV
jgi:hypothetical protein